MKSKRKINLIVIIITLVVLIVIGILFKNNKILEKINDRYKKIEETEPINLEIQIISENDENTSCILTFTSNNENDKIEKIIYPIREENIEPLTILVGGKEKVALDYQFKKNEQQQLTFKVETEKGNIISKDALINLYGIKEDEQYEIATYMIINAEQTINLSNIVPTKEGYQFVGWSTSEKTNDMQYIEDGKFIYKGQNKENVLKAVWTEHKDGYKEIIDNDSILGEISKINDSGIYNIEVNGESYSSNVVVLNSDLLLDGKNEIEGAILKDKTYTFGNAETDIGTQNSEAQNSVIVKVNGNVTITPGIKVTTCGSIYGGPKGMYLYCTGTFANNGEITMTARGAKAEGQNIYLWKNVDNNYEYVPKEGANGGDSFVLTHNGPGYGKTRNGNNGNDGINRQTAGGGTGAVRVWYAGQPATVSSGGRGTSYSGGSGSGAANRDGGTGDNNIVSGAGSDIGGAGGNGVVSSSNSSGYGQISIGGTGNPSGNYQSYKLSPVNYIQRNGTGGLLNIYSNIINNNGKITAQGVSSSTCNRSHTNSRVDTGGASGGGSINIFYNNIIKNQGNINADGGKSIYGEGGNAGGAGGNGCISIGSISTGSYVSYEE